MRQRNEKKIQTTRDFETKIEDDPIELLKSIKEHALSYQEDKYLMEIIVEALISFLITSKQKEDEHLNDYTKRFKVLREVMESHLGGPLILTKYNKSLSTYDALDPDVDNQASFDKLTAYLYLNNADQKNTVLY